MLFGGPLLTLLKAATAIRKAQDATKASGREHVPIFWLASEDHDLAEVDQVALLSKTGVETLRLGLKAPRPVPVGTLPVDGGSDEGLKHLEATLDQASELLALGADQRCAARVLRPRGHAGLCLWPAAYEDFCGVRVDRDGRRVARVSRHGRERSAGCAGARR